MDVFIVFEILYRMIPKGYNSLIVCYQLPISLKSTEQKFIKAVGNVYILVERQSTPVVSTSVQLSLFFQKASKLKREIPLCIPKRRQLIRYKIFFNATCRVFCVTVLCMDAIEVYTVRSFIINL